MFRLCLSCLVLATAASCGKMNISYPGSTHEPDSAVLFAPGLVSTDRFEHSAPAFSVDGKTVLWAIVQLPSWKAAIYEMDLENGKWSKPFRPSFSDTTASDIYPSFSPDGKVLYFSSSRKLPSGKSAPKGNTLWKVDRTSTGWAAPSPLDSTISKGGEYAPSIAANGNLYFTYGPFRSPDWNIFTSQRTGGVNTAPVKLPGPINTEGYEDGPFVAPDESYLIFESDRPGGVSGSTDLYISFKSPDGSWASPVNMGPRINTAANERFARVSPDGKYLFFGSNRRQVGGKPNFDIYWISTSVIGGLR